MQEVEETTPSSYSTWLPVFLILILEAAMVEQIVEALVLTFKIILLTFVGIVKALLPVGILPRKNVRGQIVLITGSGSGLGRMLAKEFGMLGAKVVLWDVNEKGNKETQTQLEAIGVEAHAYTVNLAKKEEIYEAAKKVKHEVGDVDILINNAGIVSGKKLFECPDELMELTMAVNCNALLFTGKAFIPKMLERNSGHIVTIASMAGKTGVAGLVDYCASKHGAIGFHESLTAEISSLKKTGVNTTVVCPFYIDTGMFDGVQTKSPNLLPILQPQLVVDRIMEAILTNQNLVAVPKFCYLVMFFASFAPASVLELMSDYFGVNETMDHFKGRAKSH